jgi:hypothetical protein
MGGNSEDEEGAEEEGHSDYEYYEKGIVAVVVVVAASTAGNPAEALHLVLVFLRDHHLAYACHDDWRIPVVAGLSYVADHLCCLGC